MTFFYRNMLELVEGGHLYIAQPPLYRVSTGKVTRYATDESERDRIVKEMKVKNLTVQRFKGLGEMNADQLWETTMNPATRTLLQVHPDNAAEADHMFTTLMGEKVGAPQGLHPRRGHQGAEPRCLTRGSPRPTRRQA